jgi:predicted nucleic acid-binding protein
MRVVLDTNILLSALMTRGTPPDRLYEEWRHGRFDLVSTEQQIEELRAVTRRSFFQARLRPSEIGRMINDNRRLAEM